MLLDTVEKFDLAYFKQASKQYLTPALIWKNNTDLFPIQSKRKQHFPLFVACNNRFAGIHTEECVDLNAKCSILLYAFHQNRNKPIFFLASSITIKLHGKLWLSSCYRRKDGRSDFNQRSATMRTRSMSETCSHRKTRVTHEENTRWGMDVGDASWCLRYTK